MVKNKNDPKNKNRSDNPKNKSPSSSIVYVYEIKK